MMRKEAHGALGFLRNLRSYAPGMSSFRRCQYIAGEPLADDSCKCNRPVDTRSAYCREHHRLCWQARPRFWGKLQP